MSKSLMSYDGKLDVNEEWLNGLIGNREGNAELKITLGPTTIDLSQMFFLSLINI